MPADSEIQKSGAKSEENKGTEIYYLCSAPGSPHYLRESHFNSRLPKGPVRCPEHGIMAPKVRITPIIPDTEPKP
jgi:hypothetical protein